MRVITDILSLTDPSEHSKLILKQSWLTKGGTWMDMNSLYIQNLSFIIFCVFGQ